MLTNELETSGLSLPHQPLERYEGILKNVEYVKVCDPNAHVVKEVSGIYTQGKEKSLKK